MYPVDQDGHQVQTVEFLLAQLFQLRCAGGHEFAAHAGFFNPVTVQHAFHGPLIAPRSQPRDDAFAHCALPPPVVLQPRVTVERNFLAFARACARVADPPPPSVPKIPRSPAAGPNARTARQHRDGAAAPRAASPHRRSPPGCSSAQLARSGVRLPVAAPPIPLPMATATALPTAGAPQLRTS